MAVWFSRKGFSSTRIFSVAALCMATFVSGCENGQMKPDTAERALAGAVSGVTCRLAARKILNASSRQANLFALACIAVSSVAMNRLVERRAAHQTNEEFYANETAQLKIYNADLSRDVKNAKSELASEKKEADRLIASTSTAKANKEELEGMQDKLVSRKSSLKKQLAVAEERRDDQKGVLTMMNSEVADTSDAQKELTELEEDIAELNAMLDDTEALTAAVGKSL